MTLDLNIQRLFDETAVRDVHLRFCRALDRRDWELLRSCYHDGATENHGPYNGDVDGFIALAQASLEATATTTHLTGNQLVEIDGDVAWHEAYCRAYQRMKATADQPEIDWIVNHRCFDRMERRDGRWGIVDRVVIVDTERLDPVMGHTGEGPAWHFGSADTTDPSYNRDMPHAAYLEKRRSTRDPAAAAD